MFLFQNRIVVCVRAHVCQLEALDSIFGILATETSREIYSWYFRFNAATTSTGRRDNTSSSVIWEQRMLWNFFDKNVNLLDMCNKQVGAISALPQPVVSMYVMCKRITIMLMTLAKYETGKVVCGPKWELGLWADPCFVQTSCIVIARLSSSYFYYFLLPHFDILVNNSFIDSDVLLLFVLLVG